MSYIINRFSVYIGLMGLLLVGCKARLDSSKTADQNNPLTYDGVYQAHLSENVADGNLECDLNWEFALGKTNLAMAPMTVTCNRNLQGLSAKKFNLSGARNLAFDGDFYRSVEQDVERYTTSFMLETLGTERASNGSRVIGYLEHCEDAGARDAWICDPRFDFTDADGVHLKFMNLKNFDLHSVHIPISRRLFYVDFTKGDFHFTGTFYGMKRTSNASAAIVAAADAADTFKRYEAKGVAIVPPDLKLNVTVDGESKSVQLQGAGIDLKLNAVSQTPRRATAVFADDTNLTNATAIVYVDRNIKSVTGREDKIETAIVRLHALNYDPQPQDLVDAALLKSFSTANGEPLTFFLPKASGEMIFWRDGPAKVRSEGGCIVKFSPSYWSDRLGGWGLNVEFTAYDGRHTDRIEPMTHKFAGARIKALTADDISLDVEKIRANANPINFPKRVFGGDPYASDKMEFDGTNLGFNNFSAGESLSIKLTSDRMGVEGMRYQKTLHGKAYTVDCDK